MQLLGLDVCPLNSVQFSNHTGYGKGKVAGDVMNDTQLAAIVDMLETNGLLYFSHVLTGTANWQARGRRERVCAWRCPRLMVEARRLQVTLTPGPCAPGCVGYIGSSSFLRQLVAVIKKIRAANPRVTFGAFRRGTGCGVRCWRP